LLRLIKLPNTFCRRFEQSLILCFSPDRFTWFPTFPVTRPAS